MFLLGRPVIGLVLIMTLLPDSTEAQTVAFAELPAHINLGDVVVMAGADGRRTKGKVTELTPSSLTLLVNETEKRTFTEAAVRRIVVSDSLKNGTLIGLGAGAVPGAILGGSLFMAQCKNEHDSGCAGPAVLVGVFTGALFGGAGAAIGAGIDALFHRAVDVSPQQRTSLTRLPLISTERWAMHVSLRF